MKAKVLVEFTISNLIDESELEEFYKGDFTYCVKEIIENEGLRGITDDEYTIIKVEQA